MEYKLKPLEVKPKHKRGDKRCRKIFLLMPYTLGRRLRWLEYAHINEEYCKYTVLIEGASTACSSLRWERVSWAD